MKQCGGCRNRDMEPCVGKNVGGPVKHSLGIILMHSQTEQKPNFSAKNETEPSQLLQKGQKHELSCGSMSTIDVSQTRQCKEFLRNASSRPTNISGQCIFQRQCSPYSMQQLKLPLLQVQSRLAHATSNKLVFAPPTSRSGRKKSVAPRCEFCSCKSQHRGWPQAHRLLQYGPLYTKRCQFGT